MKIRHRIPTAAHFRSDVVTPSYQAEVDEAMRRGQQREREAQKRLTAARTRLSREVARPAGQADRAKCIQVARELVEVRRRELLAIQRHLMSIPAAASHRGRGHGKRPIPGMKTI